MRIDNTGRNLLIKADIVGRLEFELHGSVGIRLCCKIRHVDRVSLMHIKHCQKCPMFTIIDFF